MIETIIQQEAEKRWPIPIYGTPSRFCHPLTTAETDDSNRKIWIEACQWLITALTSHTGKSKNAVEVLKEVYDQSDSITPKEYFEENGSEATWYTRDDIVYKAMEAYAAQYQHTPDRGEVYTESQIEDLFEYCINAPSPDMEYWKEHYLPKLQNK